MLSIKNFQEGRSLSLPYSKYTIITGNDKYFQELIYYKIINFFSSRRKTKDGTESDILIDGKLINKNDYNFIKISPKDIFDDELSCGKTSFLKKIIDDIVENLICCDGKYSLINDLIVEMIQRDFGGEWHNMKSALTEGAGDINLEINTMELSKKIITDELINLTFLKNGSEVEILSCFDKLIMYLNLINYVSKVFLYGKKVLLIIDNIEYKLNDDEERIIFKKIKKLSEKQNWFVFHIVNKLELIDLCPRDLESIYVANESIKFSISDFDDFIVQYELNSSSPMVAENDVMECFLRYYKYLDLKDNLYKDDKNFKILYDTVKSFL